MKLSLFLHGPVREISQRAGQLADEVIVHHSDGTELNARVVREAFSRCGGDWIFFLASDREPSGRWNRQTIERLMNQRPITHYFLPERFLVSPDRFAATAPYIGRFSLGLWRNIESISVISDDPAQAPAIAGEPAYLAGPYLDGAAAHPGPDVESLPVDDSADVKIMSPIAGDRKSGVHLRFVAAPPRMTVGKTYWATVRISNAGDRTLHGQSEFVYAGKLALTYRWLQNGQDAAHGAREAPVPFPARIAPGHEHDALVPVRAPATPGSYGLQADIVEENERAFSLSGKATSEILLLDVAGK